MNRAPLFAALLLLSNPSFACGVCVEDKIASTYDHALVSRSVAKGHPVAFFHVDGPLVQDEATRRALLAAAEPWLGGAAVLEAQVKRWRFATPQDLWAHPCHVIEDAMAPLVLAGDAFAGPRVEGAALSGLAAAQALLG